MSIRMFEKVYGKRKYDNLQTFKLKIQLFLSREDEGLYHTLLPLSLSERKKIELLNTVGTRALHNTLVSMSIQEFPVIMRNFDVLTFKFSEVCCQPKSVRLEIAESEESIGVLHEDAG